MTAIRMTSNLIGWKGRIVAAHARPPPNEKTGDRKKISERALLFLVVLPSFSSVDDINPKQADVPVAFLKLKLQNFRTLQR